MSSDNQPNLDVLKLVARLRASDVQCRIASNQEAVRAAYLRDEMGLADLFDELNFSCDLARHHLTGQLLVTEMNPGK